MDTIVVDQIIYHLPTGITDVQQLITMARQKNAQIRIRGANHSVQASTYPDETTYGYQDSIFVMLSKMNTVSIDTIENTVTVEAGCHLGYDPFDPTNISTLENSLFYQLDQAGYALPDMGGIIHQTVGGFLSTGSSGGSTKYSFLDALESITFFPADTDCPQPRTVSRSHDSDLFYAVGVSMGLLGIIVSATFSLEKHFNIKGTESITSIEECPIDMSGRRKTGKIKLQDFLKDTDYYRILWYPQPKVSRVTVWQANRSPYNPKCRTPYQEFTPILNSKLLPQIAAHIIYSGIGRWPQWLGNITGVNSKLYQVAKAVVAKSFYAFIFPKILPLFVTEDVHNKEHPNKPQEFEDFWYCGLPMDDKVNDRLFPVEFTELWIPFKEGDDTVSKVLQTLNNLFRNLYNTGTDPIPAGAFATELYAAKKSEFWMSPAYDSDVLRVDVFWFKGNLGSPFESFYPLFWDALAPFNFRCHWGKYLPPATGKQGVDYLRRQYPKWNDFLRLRQEHDPLNVFLNEYWKQHLGIWTGDKNDFNKRSW